jgi:hypothetical protein
MASPTQYKVFDPFTNDVSSELNKVSKIFFPILQDYDVFERMKYPLKDLTGPIVNMLTGEDTWLNVVTDGVTNENAIVNSGHMLINNMYVHILGIDTTVNSTTTRNDNITLKLSNVDSWLSTSEFNSTKTNWEDDFVINVTVRFDPAIDDTVKIGYMLAKTESTLDRSRFSILGTNVIRWSGNPSNSSSKLQFVYDSFDDDEIDISYVRRDIPIGGESFLTNEVNGGVVNPEGEVINDWYTE